MRYFKVLNSKTIFNIPWDMIEPYRDSCMRGHNQTLERLHERGGLAVREIWCHMTRGGDFHKIFDISEKDATTWLNQKVDKYIDENS